MSGNRGRTTLRIPQKPTVLLLVVLAAILAPILASPGSDHGAWLEVLDDAYAHVLSTLMLTDAGKIADSGSLELDGADDVVTFEASDGTSTNTYAAVAATADDGVQILKTDERHRAALQSGRRRKDRRQRLPRA